MAANRVLRRDVVIGLVLVGFGAAATAVALEIPQGPAQRTLPPNVVPLICTIGIGLCGVGLILRGLLTKHEFRIRWPVDLQQTAVMLLFAAFFLLFEHIDYRVLLGVFLPAVMLTLGCRSWQQIVAVTAATILGVWLFFVRLFNVFLPTWV